VTSRRNLTYFPHITTAISLNFLSFDHMSG
jgi:hypothetical protein